MRVLGIEASCDGRRSPSSRHQPGTSPWAACWPTYAAAARRRHRHFGGIVPEIAARAHLERVDGLMEDALAEARLDLDDLEAIAATGGPGLIGGMMVGHDGPPRRSPSRAAGRSSPSTVSKAMRSRYG